jgi:hypothetical protein
MSFLLLLVVFLGFTVVNMIVTATTPRKQPAATVIPDWSKRCPPHKWRHQEIKDFEGNTVKWKMVCDVCGPLKQIGESGNET